MDKNAKQKIQDDAYSFPYHYIPRFQPNFSQCYNQPSGFNYAATLEFIINEVKEIKPRSVCDVGTGDGRLVKELNTFLKEKEVKITGIDYSERAINLARALNPSLDFRKINVAEEKLDQTFDVITLIETFEHVPLYETKKFIKGLHGLLNKKGILLITVPHKNLPLEEKHFQHFDYDTLEEYFKKYFTTEKIFFLDNPNKLQKLIKKILTNRFFILNQTKTKNFLYKIYKKYCFFSTEKKCKRIYIKFRKKENNQ
jgi:2-polyprenyl-3-methyl-5-hydroxy-6-metoxy-1,4-benzoquinol methylase